MNNKLYDLINRIAKYFLPAVGALYFGLSQIWGFPYGEEVVGSLALVGTFLAAVLVTAKANYNPNGPDDPDEDPEDRTDDDEEDDLDYPYEDVSEIHTDPRHWA